MSETCNYVFPFQRHASSEPVSVRCPHERHNGEEYCILHGRNPDKNQALFQQKVGEQIDRPVDLKTLEAGDPYFELKEQIDQEKPWIMLPGTVFFASFDFPSEIKGNLLLDQACFEGDVNLDLRNRMIEGHCFCQKAVIKGSAVFRRVSVGGVADFEGASVGGDADFEGASVGGHADFVSASFGGRADFQRASFGKFADFGSASFGGDADFQRASVGEGAYFGSASFGGRADFQRASFGKFADFVSASVGGNAYFVSASVGGSVSFQDFVCLGRFCDFSFAKVAGKVHLRSLKLTSLRMDNDSLDLTFDRCVFSQIDVRSSASLRLIGCAYPRGEQDGNPYQAVQESLGRFSDLLEHRNNSLREAWNQLDEADQSELEKRFKWSEERVENESDSPDSVGSRNGRARIQNMLDLFTTLAEGWGELQRRRTITAEGILEPGETNESFHYWDFTNRDLGAFQFVECDLDAADFTSSKTEGAYFDSCRWNRPDKKPYSGLAFHEGWLEIYDQTQDQKEKERAGLRLEKTRNVYNRLKKHFETEHDYEQAGDFHYREMELRRKVPANGWDRWFLRIYGTIGDYGESYPKLFFWLSVFTLGFPALVATLAGRFGWGNGDAAWWNQIKAGWTYFLSSIFPRTLGETLGIVPPKGVGGNAYDLSKGVEESSPDPSGLDGFLTMLGVENAGWSIFLFGLLTVFYYVAFFTLATLFAMAVRRRYRR